MNQPSPEEKAKVVPQYTFAVFLAETPPSTNVWVSDFYYDANLKNSSGFTSGRHVADNRVKAPRLQMWCKEDTCDGRMFFSSMDAWIENAPAAKMGASFFMQYSCSNCGKSHKTFSIKIHAVQLPGLALVVKYGEYPPFGPHVPTKLVTLIGGDREMYLKGRRCETQGLGIGAFAYYRRIVENQKLRIIEKIKSVAVRLGETEELLKLLDEAAVEQQFDKAITMIGKSIPRSLFVQGENPFKLLHSSLSEGVHNDDDDECLKRASAIRTVLAAFADKLAAAMEEHNELAGAVQELAKYRQEKDKRKKDGGKGTS